MARAAVGVSRHGSCKRAEVGSRHTFWFRDMVWFAWGHNLNLVSRPSLGMAGGPGVMKWDWCHDRARLWAVSRPMGAQRPATRRSVRGDSAQRACDTTRSVRVT